MKKILLAATAAIFSTPAFAGVYVNTELNQGYEGSDYFGRAIDFHVGYEGGKDKVAYYIQFFARSQVTGGPTKYFNLFSEVRSRRGQIILHFCSKSG